MTLVSIGYTWFGLFHNQLQLWLAQNWWPDLTNPRYDIVILDSVPLQMVEFSFGTEYYHMQ